MIILSKRKKKDEWIELPPWLSNIILYGIAGLLFYYVAPIMWGWGLITFTGFIISCSLSFYRKVVLREHRAPAYIAIIYMVTNTLTNSMWPAIKENLFSNAIFTAILIALIWALVYWRAKIIKDSLIK